MTPYNKQVNIMKNFQLNEICKKTISKNKQKKIDKHVCVILKKGIKALNEIKNSSNSFGIEIYRKDVVVKHRNIEYVVENIDLPSIDIPCKFSIINLKNNEKLIIDNDEIFGNINLFKK